MSSEGAAVAWTVRRIDVTQHTEEEAGLAYLSVGLAESPDLTGRYLEFQLADDEDEREEGYCVVDSPPEGVDVSDPLAVAAMVAGHRTLCGGVTECRLSGDQLTFTLTDEAQQTFGWPAVLTLQLDITSEDRTTLQRGLTQVLSVGADGTAPAMHV
jgi:hypothetical protein